MTQPSTGPLDPRPRKIPHTLTLHQPLVQGSNYVERLNDRFTFYQRSFRWFGGCWQGMLELENDPDDSDHLFDADYAHDWVQNRLGYHFSENMGTAPIWSGMVDEVEVAIDGWGERYSLLPVANRVRAAYVDANGVAQKTAWLNDTVSQSRFGIRQKELVMERETSTSTEAGRFANAELARLAYPTPEPVAVSAGQRDRLIVRMSGYVFTANARYVSIGSGTYGVSTFITNVVNTDLPFIELGRIQTNTEETHVGGSEVTPVWEGFKGVIMLRSNPTSMPYTVRVMADRRLNYFQPTGGPSYRWVGRAIHSIAGAGVPVNPWEVYPRIVRNPSARSSSPPYGSYLTDGRDRIMFEVTMSTRQEQPIITWAGSTEAELKKALEIRRGQEIHSL